MGSDTYNGGSDHFIRVESTQLFVAEISPDSAEFLTGDGEVFDRVLNKEIKTGHGLEFEDEIKRTFECTCGDRFRKPETAREHLESVLSEKGETDDTKNTDSEQ